jgi:ketosteroid isomerase-like protein
MQLDESLAMYKAIVRAKLRRLYAGVAEGKWQPIVDNQADDFVYRFIGDTPLGGTRRTKAAMAAWWTRVLTLCPGARLTPQRIIIEGWPWNTTLMTYVHFDAMIPGPGGVGRVAYQNEVMQLMTLKWGRITSILTLEDTQRFARILPDLAAAGIADATAAPITDAVKVAA